MNRSKKNHSQKKALFHSYENLNKTGRESKQSMVMRKTFYAFWVTAIYVIVDLGNIYDRLER